MAAVACGGKRKLDVGPGRAGPGQETGSYTLGTWADHSGLTGLPGFPSNINHLSCKSTAAGTRAAAAIMSLGSFSRLLTHTRGRRAKVESSPGIAASMLVAGRPARSLRHTIRGVGAAAVIAAALTGGAGILIFKERPDDDVMKPRQEDINKGEVDINKDMGKHQMDVVEAKFHKWMEEMGREYPNEEEKAYRFEVFKENLKEIETLYEGRVKDILPNLFGDRTDDEISSMMANCHKPRSKEYEASLMEMKKKLDERMILIEKEKAERNVVNCSKK